MWSINSTQIPNSDTKAQQISGFSLINKNSPEKTQYMSLFAKTLLSRMGDIDKLAKMYIDMGDVGYL